MLINSALYDDGRVVAEPALDGVAEALHRQAGFVWIALRDPTDDELHRLQHALDLPPLASVERVPAFARATEGVLLLVNHAQVSSDQLLTGLGRIQDGGFPLLGVLPVKQVRQGTVSFETYAERRSQAS